MFDDIRIEELPKKCEVKYIDDLILAMDEIVDKDGRKHDDKGKFTFKSKNTLKNIDKSCKIKKRELGIYLSKEEYGFVFHNLNTNLTKEELKKKIVTKAIGDTIYRIKINKFNEYLILSKKVIK